MRTPLTAERLRDLLDYNPDTGVFRWRVTRASNARAGSVAGSIDKEGRWRVKIDGRDYFASRLAILYVTGAWPRHQIDHVDGNKANDRVANLRDVSQKINQQNKATPQRSNRTGLLGAHRNARGRRYRAVIHVDGKQLFLGTFDTPEAAHRAYVNAKLDLHPGAVAARFGERP